jgi:hypothetical protein
MDDATRCWRWWPRSSRCGRSPNRVLADEPDAVIPWTGCQMAVAKFLALRAQRAGQS